MCVDKSTGAVNLFAAPPAATKASLGGGADDDTDDSTDDDDDDVDVDVDDSTSTPDGEAAEMTSQTETQTQLGHPPRLIIAGAPASGKGTQCARVRERYGVEHISTGDLLRAEVAAASALGNAAKGFMDQVGAIGSITRLLLTIITFLAFASKTHVTHFIPSFHRFLFYQGALVPDHLLCYQTLTPLCIPSFLPHLTRERWCPITSSFVWWRTGSPKTIAEQRGGCSMAFLARRDR
jgi:hypothetical protein